VSRLDEVEGLDVRIKKSFYNLLLILKTNHIFNLTFDRSNLLTKSDETYLKLQKGGVQILKIF